MIQLLDGIKKVLERYIINITPITSAANAGDTTITIASARRYKACEEIVVYNGSTKKGELHTVSCVLDAHNIEIDSPLVASYSADNGAVQKLVDSQWLQGIYIGDPGKISHYPAISIDAKEKTNEWFTLESTSETFNIDITIFCLAEDYERTYRMMGIYAKMIETALFRSLFPLVQPYELGVLAEDVAATDTTIKIVDPLGIQRASQGYVFLESWDHLRSNRIKQSLGSGVFEMFFPAGRDFEAGDTLVKPYRHFYNAFPRSIKYGTINQETVVLKAAVISYMAQEEVKRGTPMQDPLTY